MAAHVNHIYSRRFLPIYWIAHHFTQSFQLENKEKMKQQQPVLLFVLIYLTSLAASYSSSSSGDRLCTGFFDDCIVFNEQDYRPTSANNQHSTERGVTIPEALRRMTGHHSTLFGLLVKSGLMANLTRSGPFTLFAPTDEAFDTLRANAPVWYNTLTNNPQLLNTILSGHILNGRLPVSDLRDGLVVTSASGEKIYFHVIRDGQNLAVNGSRILGQLDVDNGIIYAVNKMLVEDIFELLPLLKGTTGQDLTIMYDALRISGLHKIMNMPGTGPFTMFVPNDEAFRALPPGMLQSLMKNPERLRALLLNHLLHDTFFVRQRRLARKGTVKTVGGGRLFISKTGDGQVLIGENKARIIVPNRPGNNGVVHIIDKVLLLSSTSTPVSH